MPKEVLNQRLKWTLLHIFVAFSVSPLVHILQYYVYKLQPPWPSQFPIHLSNSESPLGSVWNSLPYTIDWKLPSGKNLGQSECLPHLFPFFQGSPSYAAYFQYL